MESLTLESVTRTALGRRAKDVLKERQIPAVVYGHGIEAKPVSVASSSFARVFAKAGSSSLIDLVVDGAAPAKAIIKEVQYHPVRSTPIHVDFQQVKMTEKMRVMVPLVFTGESEAVKVLGGTLVRALDHLEVECLPGDIPHEISIDISALKTFDDAVTVADIAPPKGVAIMSHGELTVAFVERPMTEEELKKLDESQVGDVTAVKAEGEEKHAEKEAETAAAETEGNAS